MAHNKQTNRQTSRLIQILAANQESRVFKFTLVFIIFSITGDGVLSKAEYVSLISGYMVDPEVVKAELREAFMTFDKLKRGYLDLKQMSKALRCVGEPLSEIEIKQLIKLADKNNDGKIDVDGMYPVHPKYPSLRQN